MLTKCRPHSRTRALLSLTIAFALMTSLLVFPSAASKRVASPRLEAETGATPPTLATTGGDNISSIVGSLTSSPDSVLL